MNRFNSKTARWQQCTGVYFPRGKTRQSASLSQSLWYYAKGGLRGNEDGERLQHAVQEQIPTYRNRHCTTR